MVTGETTDTGETFYHNVSPLSIRLAVKHFSIGGVTVKHFSRQVRGETFSGMFHRYPLFHR